MKSALLTIILFFGHLLVSCINQCGFGSQQEYFDWDGIKITCTNSRTNQAVSSGKFDELRFDFSIQMKMISLGSNLSSNELMACSPVGPITEVLVSDLLITSSNTFQAVDKDYPPNSNLVEIFTYRGYGGNALMIKRESFITRDFDFSIAAKPQGTQKHDFTFQFTLEDGRVYIASIAVTLEP